MFLYKASGATYKQVIRQHLHTFPYSPVEAHKDDFILLSKNRADCGMTERQVQYAAKLLDVREATNQELAKWFPGVQAGQRWRYAISLYWVKPFRRPFNLTEVPGFNAKRYNTVQGYAKLDKADEMAMLTFLIDTNADLLIDVINNAVHPDELDHSPS